MDGKDAQIVRKAFAGYYENADFRIPSIEQREFGIGNQKKIDSRHLDFPGVAAFRAYLCTNTPLFVSHSTSYYDFPGASPMIKKGWRGADVVFDLDIHAEGKYGAYPKLGEVKQDATRLVDDFILGDFGIKKEHVLIAFSGNRGYHVHIRDPDFISLGGEERRELVDYVMGIGLDYLSFLTLEGKPQKLVGPRDDEGGYRGRFARAAIKLVREDPLALSKKFKGESEREFFIGGIKEGNWSKTSLKLPDLQTRLSVVGKTLSVGSVNTDAGVTQDLSKLIRVPNSIHGDTGLIARITDDITKFEPWHDAWDIPKGASPPEAKIRFTEDVPALELHETVGPFKKGDEKAFPQHLAVFFVCKGSATFIV
jgi:DNA primase small subunit